jgi:hypothetical protein
MPANRSVKIGQLPAARLYNAVRRRWSKIAHRKRIL